MIRRSSKILLEITVGLLAGFALLVGMAVWRLSAGPVPLDFLTPYLEEVFAKTRSGMTVEVGETLLSWEGWSRTFDLSAREVRIRDAEGETVVVLPDASVTLSLRALVAGTIAPTVIEVNGALVSLNRDSDGRFRLASGPRSETPEAGSGAPEFSAIVPALADLFLHEPDPSSPLGYLTAVRILEGKLVVDDRRLETVWFAPSANMELRRHDSGLAVFLGLKLALGEGLVDADLAVLYDDLRSRVDVAARLSGLQPATLAAVLPGFEFLEGVRVPVEANASAVFDTEGTFRSLKFDATGGAGEIMLPGEPSETGSGARPVAGFDLRGNLDGLARRLDVEAFDLRFGSPEKAGPGLSGSLAVDGLGGDLEIVAEARLDELATNDLGHYWPESLSRGARKWTLGHIRDGAASDGSINLALQVPGGDFKALKIARLDGGFAYQDLTVHYIKEMPPITDGRGRATFDRSGLRFQIAGGRMGDLEITGGTVDVLGLDIKKPGIAIEGDAVGPLPQVLEVLDHEKLRLLKHIGIRPAESAGQVETHLTFHIPLIKGLSFKDVGVKADARIRQGAIASFLLGRDGTEMALDLEVSRETMTVTGPLHLAGVPLEIDWRQDFTGQAEPRTLLKLEIPTIDTAGRRNLGFDWAPFWEGPSSATVVATVAHDRSGRVNVATNLTRAHLAFPFLFWEKPPGTEGQAHVSLSLVDGKVTTIELFDVEAGGLMARGRGELTPDGRNYQALHFDEMSFHGTKVQVASLARDGPGLVVGLGRGVVDAAAFLKPDLEAENGAAGGLEPDPKPKTPLRISGSGLESLYFAEGRYLQGVALDMERSTAGWEQVTIRGEVPRALWARGPNGAAAAGEAGGGEAKIFDLKFGPSGMGDYRLVINMNDMGAGLRALDAMDTVAGGDLTITGISSGPAPDHPIQGRIEAQDYTLVEAPVMAQLLSLSSLTGIANVLSGDGLEFNRLVGEFTLENGVATTDLVRAYGGALGLTAKGSIDFRRKMIDLRGTVVPAYTVNRILGKIPILGPLLTGGEGEGIVAFIYEMKGPFAEPVVTVNPLSMLTPGFLRGLFGVGSGSGEEDAAQGEDEGDDSRPRAFPTGADR